MAKNKTWPQNIQNLLGTVPDQEIANQLGVSRATIVRYRHSPGIEPSEKRRRRAKYWTVEREALFGTISDRDVVPQLNVPGLNRA